MLLFLLRHGPAEPAHRGQADAERALTPDGLTLMRRQAAALRRLALKADCVLSSPYHRALQTAGLIAGALRCPVVTEAALQPGGSLEDLAYVLNGRACGPHVWVVGHQPSLGTWTYQLTGARATIRPGTLVVIEGQRIRPQGGTLRGLYDPEWLAGLGGTGHGSDASI